MRTAFLIAFGVLLLVPLPVYAAHVAARKADAAWFAIFAVIFLIGAGLVATAIKRRV